jgi:hypothetical protein
MDTIRGRRQCGDDRCRSRKNNQAASHTNTILKILFAVLIPRLATL